MTSIDTQLLDSVLGGKGNPGDALHQQQPADRSGIGKQRKQWEQPNPTPAAPEPRAPMPGNEQV
jgi:hypothetical protein